MGLFTKKSSATKATADKTENKDTKKKSTTKKESMKNLYSGTKLKTKKSIVGQDKSTQTVKTNGTAYKILIKPLITEKAADFSSKNKYVFEVGVKSNKVEVAKAINEVYGVMPISVNIINMNGKVKRQGKNFGRRKDWKKAIITLAKGKTINIYEGV